MRIYLFDEPEKFNYEAVFEQLSADRQKKVLKYKNIKSRNLSAAAYMLLKFAVKDFAGLDEVPEMIFTEHGKPYFKDVDSLFFNLSHCPVGAVCGVSNSDIGVDIQDIRKVSEGTVQKVMCAGERELIKNSPDPEREFARIWSVKESCVKLNGKGISFGLKNVDTTRINNIKTFEYEKYFVSVAGDCEKLQSEPILLPDICN